LESENCFWIDFDDTEETLTDSFVPDWKNKQFFIKESSKHWTFDVKSVTTHNVNSTE
jgi:hypothetical protein